MLAQARSVPVSAPTFIAMRFDVPTEQEDIAYYRRRIAAEALAAGATCPSARLAHLELAQLYADRLGVLERQFPASGMPIEVPAPESARAIPAASGGADVVSPA